MTPILRSLTFIIAACASCMTAGADGLECTSGLLIPDYPPLARSARLSGTAAVHLQIGRDRQPRNIDVEGVHELLRTAVRDSVDRSKYNPKCRGTTLEVFFEFRIEGMPTDKADRGRVMFVWPNRFIVTAKPALLQVSSGQ